MGEIISVYPHGGGGAGGGFFSPAGVIVTPDEFGNLRGAGLLGASNAWTANQAELQPFVPTKDMTITQMAIVVATQNGNVDVGIYDSSFGRLTSAGSTAAGAAGIQVFDVANVSLTAGETYYSAFATDSTSLRIFNVAIVSSAVEAIAGGVVDQATAFPLPSSITPGVLSEGAFPLIGMSTLTTYG
jgi:hypothetical protein